MADRRLFLPLIILALLPAPWSFLPAQETPTETSSSQEGITFVPDYFFEVQEDGTPLFSQVLSWREVPNCLDYELILEDSEGTEIVRERTEKTSVTVSLRPGEYRYSIIVYNLLDKPELQTDWLPIVIVKAEIPEIEDLSPSAIYMEEAKFRVLLRGTNLLPDAEYTLVDQKTGNEVLAVEKKTVDRNETVELFLPERKIDFGDYLVRVINPGGLTDVSDTGFVVRYQKPVDFYVSAGYSPNILLYDQWVRNNWPKTFYPAGAVARVGLFVVKRRWGYMGPEIFTHILLMKGGISDATITSFSMKTGLNCAYKYLFTPKIQGVIRLGGGVDLNNYSFDYEGTAGPEMTSADFFLTGGISVQGYIKKKLFIEVGGDWFHTFHNGYSEGGLEPFVSLGFNL